jgi:alcohol dehydrogenase, propanol-preferring
MVDFGVPLELFETATPEPTGTQVLLRVRAAGVCHSDLHIWEGSYDLGFGRKLSLKDRGISVPLTLGHETAGEVVAAGPDAHGVLPGDVRLVYPWIGCGGCPVCLRGDENLCAKPRFLGVYCDGGYSDHITVPHPKYLLDLEGLDPVSAAPYACSGVTTYSALAKLTDVIATEPISRDPNYESQTRSGECHTRRFARRQPCGSGRSYALSAPTRPRVAPSSERKA